MALLALLAVDPAGAAYEILKPQEAFRYTVEATANEISVHWDIEPGHYLYRERMGYRSLSPGLVLGDAMLPAGKPYEDEFFGRMEIYRDSVVARLPIASLEPGTTTADLEIRSQGCADIGLCYPPQVWRASVALPSGAAGGKLARLLGGVAAESAAADQPLPMEQAFRPTVEVLDPFRVRVNWLIEPGYYLYRDKLAIEARGDIARAGPPTLPPGTPMWDEHFGETLVYYDQVQVEVPLLRPTPAGGLVELVLDYQGCKEDSICYPPGRTMVALELPPASGEFTPRATGGPAPVAEQDRLAGLIAEGNLLLVLATFAGLGLLLAFTPCVLPMVPIISGIVAGQGKDVTTGRAFALSLTYVLGMAITYTAAGAAFAAAGGQIQAALQKPWIIVGVAALFVTLALSMFGVYELRLPATLQNRLTQAGSRQKTGTFVGTALMGALSALVVTTCVAPPLVASLTVIAQAGDVARGAAALFALSIGMGIPLLVVGTSAGRLLPRAGPWMNAVKGAFGFLLLGLAVWMLERILPGALTLALWAALVFMAGVFLGAFQPLEAGAGPGRKLAKGAGLLAALYGAALLIGALSGARDPLQPLRLASPGSSQPEPALAFTAIKTVADLEGQIASAAARGQPLMLDFYADWCVSCKEMERYTFSDAGVQQSLDGVLLLKADVTANDADDQALLARFGIFGPPTIVFFDALGTERNGYRVVGFMPPDEFAAHAAAAVRGSS
jgi:thiol:disulfide interchange protein DsbD